VRRPTRLIAIQRRQFFREPAVVETFCSKSPDYPSRIEGLTRNIGGGGVLLRTHQIEALRELVDDRRVDEPFWVELRLPDRPLHALAELAWLNIEEDQSAADLALEFVDLPDIERERLIRYLFVLQREALKKGF